jgi:hypothetical protein
MLGLREIAWLCEVLGVRHLTRGFAGDAVIGLFWCLTPKGPLREGSAEELALVTRGWRKRPAADRIPRALGQSLRQLLQHLRP